MLYRITDVIAHPDHTVTVTWADGVAAVVDLSPVIAKGNVRAAGGPGVLRRKDAGRYRSARP
jgi:hypothetical protein